MAIPDFASDETPETETAPVAVPVETPEPQPEPSQEPVPADVPTPAPEPAPTPDLAAPADESNAPLTPSMLAATLAERDRRQAAEARVRELEQWRAQQEALIQRQQTTPDPYADPEGFQAYQLQVVQQAAQAELYNQNLRLSQRMAAIEHGKDAVEAAKAWFDGEGCKDAHFNAKVQASDDPYDTVVKEWRARQIVEKFNPTEFEEFQRWKSSQSQQAPTASGMVPAARPTAPRPSIAGAPSAGHTSDAVGMDGRSTFQAMFR